MTDRGVRLTSLNVAPCAQCSCSALRSSASVCPSRNKRRRHSRRARGPTGELNAASDRGRGERGVSARWPNAAARLLSDHAACDVPPCGRCGRCTRRDDSAQRALREGVAAGGDAGSSHCNTFRRLVQHSFARPRYTLQVPYEARAGTEPGSGGRCRRPSLRVAVTEGNGIVRHALCDDRETFRRPWPVK